MRGIIGIVGTKDVAPLLVEGLRRLDYRGYDSAGIATLVNGAIDLRRAKGKLTRLQSLLQQNPITGSIGIGHTRWATHGQPSESNAHPHSDGQVAVVHNGIIENLQTIRAEIAAAGRVLTTDTDTEVVVHLISTNLEGGLSPRQAISQTLRKLEGAFALAILLVGNGGRMYGARRGSPLAIGFGDGETYLGSDALALSHLTQRVAYLEDGDWVELTHQSATIFDADSNEVTRPVTRSSISSSLVGKGKYRHFMEKEIHEQPTAIGQTLCAYFDPIKRAIKLPALPFNFRSLTGVSIVACGTSYYAGMVVKYWLERYARIPVEIDVASEFRYRLAPMQQGGLAIFISQSGETADTLAALRYARAQGQHIVSIVNVPESTIARESDVVFQTRAGPEIGVASTKAFTTQLAVLACFTIVAARARGTISHAMEERLSKSLTDAPSLAADILNDMEVLKGVASDVSKAADVLYLGRGLCYPIALEGALKLKELSYIHAEGYAAGEMKHGPIALIDETVPVIVIAPSDELFAKTASNLQEVSARGGQVTLLSDRKGIDSLGHMTAAAIRLPTVSSFVAPLLYAIPVQSLAYHVAVIKGTDVDQPRNLAKSVTVE